MEKFAGSGVSLHVQSGSNKENRRTEGLNRYLQTLQSNPGAATGQRAGVSVRHIWKMGILTADTWRHLLRGTGSYSSYHEKTYLLILKFSLFRDRCAAKTYAKRRGIFSLS